MRKIELILAISGAFVCVAVSFWLWQTISAIQTMWPLPALYLIEMAVLGLVAMFGSLGDFPSGGLVIWVVVGLFLGFVILGAWSVGPIYLPMALLFAFTAVLFDKRRKQNIAFHLGFCLVAGLIQITLMLILIQLR